MDVIKETRELLAEPVTMVVGGLSVGVHAFQFRQLSAVARLAMPMISEIAKSPNSGDAAHTDDLDWLSVYERHTDRLHGLMALSTGMTETFIATLEIDDGLALLEKVVEVNAAFFVRALPRLMQLAVQMTLGLSSSKGPNPSASADSTGTATSESGPATPTPSSPADTAGPTS